MATAGGLDVADFAFFVADASGQLGGEIATRRGILALRKFEPGKTLMSVSFDAVSPSTKCTDPKSRISCPTFASAAWTTCS